MPCVLLKPNVGSALTLFCLYDDNLRENVVGTFLRLAAIPGWVLRCKGHPIEICHLYGGRRSGRRRKQRQRPTALRAGSHGRNVAREKSAAAASRRAQAVLAQGPLGARCRIRHARQRQGCGGRLSPDFLTATETAGLASAGQHLRGEMLRAALGSCRCTAAWRHLAPCPCTGSRHSTWRTPQSR